MAQVTNSFNGGTNGTSITTGNSGGSSGDAFDYVEKGSGAYLDYDDSPVHSGPFSARFHTGATAATSYLRYDSGSALGSRSTIYGRAYFYLGEAPDNAFNLIRVRNSGGTTLASIELQPDRKFKTREGDAGGYTVIATSPTALPLGQWVRLEWKFILHGSTGHIRLYVYEDPESATHTYTLTDSNNLDTGGGPATRYELGVTNSKAETGWFRLDDIEWDTAAYPGALADTTAPSVPSNVAAVAVSGTEAEVSWTASTDNVAVTGYKVYRDTPWTTPIATVLAATTYLDSSLSASTAYVYKVKAIDAAGNESALSSAANVTTAATDSTAPTVPTNVTATADVAEPQIVVAWTASTDAVGVTGYHIYRDTFTDPPIALVDAGNTSYLDADLAAATAYSYKVTAIDAVGNQSAQSSAANATTAAAPDTTDPTTPTNLAVTVASATQLNLAWTASTDAVGVDHYDIWRDTFTGDPVASTTTNSFSDTGRAPGTTHNYEVAAVDAAGNVSARSSRVGNTTTSGTFQVMHGFYQGENKPEELAAIGSGLGKDFAAFRHYDQHNGPSPSAMSIANSDNMLLVISCNNKKGTGGTNVTWAQIGSGSDDTFIHNYGRALQDGINGDEVVFTFYHEPHDDNPDGTEKPDGDPKNVKTEGAQYRAAFRRFHDRFRAQGIAEDGYSWLRKDGDGGKIVMGYSAVLARALNGTGGSQSTKYVAGADNFYPGGEYVDVLLHDEYNTIGSSVNRLFATPANYTRLSGMSFDWREAMDLCEAQQKPLLIGEWGSMPENPPQSSCDSSSTNMSPFSTVLKNTLTALSHDDDRNGWFEQASEWIRTDPRARKWFAGGLYYHSRRWLFTNPTGTADHLSGCIKLPGTGPGVEGRDGWIAGFVNRSEFVSTPVPFFSVSAGVGTPLYPRGTGGTTPPPPPTTGLTFLDFTNNVTPANASSLTLDKPSGVATNDVLVAMIQGDYCTTSHTPPTDWTLLTWREEYKYDENNPNQNDPVDNDPEVTGGKDLTGYIFYKVVTNAGTEPASYTFNHVGTDDHRFSGGTLMAFRGVNTTTPIYDYGCDGEQSNTVNEINCPSISAAAGSALLCMWAHDDGVDTKIPSDMTQMAFFKLPKGGNDDAHATGIKLNLSSGATGNKTATYPRDVGGQNEMGFAVTLRPA